MIVIFQAFLSRKPTETIDFAIKSKNIWLRSFSPRAWSAVSARTNSRYIFCIFQTSRKMYNADSYPEAHFHTKSQIKKGAVYARHRPYKHSNNPQLNLVLLYFYAVHGLSRQEVVAISAILSRSGNAATENTKSIILMRSWSDTLSEITQCSRIVYGPLSSPELS